MSLRSNSSSSSSNFSKEDERNKVTSTLDSRFNQTLKNVQGLLKGQSFRGKVLITQRSDPLDQSAQQSPNNDRRFSKNDTKHRDKFDRSVEVVPASVFRTGFTGDKSTLLWTKLLVDRASSHETFRSWIKLPSMS
ncbi:unnamed protein product [Fraxinus pennsylvanica]|uniref:Uncharacterized protein n=1 Tax=Fraxinus pennsylvanica TaxID=56036 RepID=A0AAD1ZWS6_9LAMI|nr:unnamed protein product [Fraxinus pennsylvanica]